MQDDNQQGTSSESSAGFDFARAKGLLMMMLSAMMTTAMNIIIKVQSSNTEVNVIQAVIIRNLFLAFGCWIHMKRDGVNFIDIPRNLFKLLFMRGILGFMSTMGLYLAIDFLPLSLAITIYYT
jgi:drug/metabolite transporter (DMT)-like permease